MPKKVLQIQFAELDNLSVDEWIDKMKAAIKKAEGVSGYELSEATVNIALAPSLSIKFIKKKPSASARNR